MDSNSDRPSGTEKIDTVPPPPGEDDAYSAPTRVGTLPAAVLELMKSKEAEKKAAEKKAQDASPQVDTKKEPKVPAKPIGQALDDAVEALFAERADAPVPPQAGASAVPAKAEERAQPPAAEAIAGGDEEEDVATMLFNHPQNAGAKPQAPSTPAQAEVEPAPVSGPAPTSSALRNGSGEVVSQDILSPEPIASPLAPPPLPTTGASASPAIIGLAVALAVALVAVVVLALR
jgi:hypothetical protein